jgi:predicted ATPase
VPTKIVLFEDRYMKRGRNVLSGYDASEGALYVLFSLVLLLHPRSPRFYAVENIDHALHPRLARALVEMIAEHAKRLERQVVLTTHNPLVLDGLDITDDAIRLFAVDRDTRGRTRVSRIKPTAALKKARAKGMVLSQMWVSGLLGAVPNLV